MYGRSPANKGEEIITIRSRGRFYGEQKLEKIFLDDIAWTSNHSHVECVMSMQRNGHSFSLLGEPDFY
jgi:hypothetical protein